MHIIIPMSGVGQRFANAGYKTLKPLIEMDGKPMVEHVVNLFPGETKFTFICNSTHLETTEMKGILNRITPHANIVPIEPHKKGPVYAATKAFDLIENEEEVIVNYCDFSTYWNYQDFLKETRGKDADGAVVSYKGFHPHMLGTTNYAFMRDDNKVMLEIKEKEPFTDNRMQEYASNGTYYFKKGSYVKKYFQKLIDEDINLNNEFYVSLIYNQLVQDGLKVTIYEIEHMLQWGTPEDVEEYHGWSHFFRDITSSQNSSLEIPNSLNLIPMAGAGQRFKDEGYETPKPLIEVSGFPMVIQAATSLPKAQSTTFICQKEHARKYNFKKEFKAYLPNSNIVEIEGLTEGQAITCALGLKPEDDEKFLNIGACDNGTYFDQAAFSKIVNSNDFEAIVWTVKATPNHIKNYKMYGWVSKDETGAITKVGVKEYASDTPENDEIILGAFSFKTAKVFKQALEDIKIKDRRVRNEFYVDTCIQELVEHGQRVVSFPVTYSLCWGTPNEYKTFEYWQSFFHKCPWHPYRLEKDSMFNQEKRDEYHARYTEKTGEIS